MKLGLDHAWTLVALANQITELAWMAFALLVTAVAVRRLTLCGSGHAWTLYLVL